MAQPLEFTTGGEVYLDAIAAAIRAAEKLFRQSSAAILTTRENAIAHADRIEAENTEPIILTSELEILT